MIPFCLSYSGTLFMPLLFRRLKERGPRHSVTSNLGAFRSLAWGGLVQPPG